jgi:predicted DNA-binding protein
MQPKRHFDITLFSNIFACMKKATTFRLNEDVQAGLDLISHLHHRPKNKLVNEAVAEYVARQAHETGQALADMLSRLGSHQYSDPNFEQAIDAFVEAEASCEKNEDPMEGSHHSSQGPITKKLRQLINA